ncbi:MAG: class I SAM-dependent methyltransferase [Acidobacteria bacterium]|nr:class I SAM-dependent methyltransferase [Acidobacteriota bacterium]
MRHWRLPLACALFWVTVFAQTAPTTTTTTSERWNKTFSSDALNIRKGPNRLLAAAIAERKPGTALDLGMGQGRNSLFLAEKGWKVTGVDLSDVGIAKAKQTAAAKGLQIETVLKDLNQFDPGKEKWDLILLSYMQGWFHSSPLNHAKRFREALKPGGVLVIEGFAGEGSPGGVASGYSTNSVLRTFDSLRIIYYEDSMDEADWRPGQKSRIVRMIAEKERIE